MTSSEPPKLPALLRSIPYFEELTPRHLSGLLLILTVVFIMLAEVLIYVPSIANFRHNWLKAELDDAQIASLAMDATGTGFIPSEVEMELLKNAGVLQVALRRDETRILILTTPDIPMTDELYDLQEANVFSMIYDAVCTLLIGKDRIITVRDVPSGDSGALIEIILEERLLREAMLDYSKNILILSIVISIFSASLVFLALHGRFVAPMKRITESMVHFRRDPEDVNRIITPTSKIIEIGTAEQELRDMQSQIRQALHQQKRLAELGTAVSKINHDLRNILSSAQLLSDMMTKSEDPKVKRLAPKLVSSIDRAIDLATSTLKHGKAEETPPQATRFKLMPLVDEVIDHLGVSGADKIQWQINIKAAREIHADREHMFRILMNLLRNAVQAVCESSDNRDKNIEISTAIVGDQYVSVDIKDAGPGIPRDVQEHLFEAFATSGRAGSVGLGLSIAKELADANHCDLQLVSSTPEGTHFRIIVPLPIPS